MQAARVLGGCLLAAGLMAGCSASDSTVPSIPTLEDTDRGSGAVTTVAAAAADAPVSLDLALARHQRCLEEQGIIQDPDGVGLWITAELSGEPQDGPLRQRHREGADRAFAACADLQAAIDQEAIPPEPDDPDLIRAQLAFQECIEQYGYEFEATADGWRVEAPEQPGTPAFEEFEMRIGACEDEVG